MKKKEKNKYHILTHIYETYKNGRGDSLCKADIETQTQKANVLSPKWESRGGMIWEIGIDIYTLLILCTKQVTNENLLYILGNSSQSSVVI